MRAAFAATLLTLAAAAAPAVATAQTVTAPLGQAVRLPVRGIAADVVVGDPKIADVTVVNPTALFVSGKGYGATNLIVLDGVGRTLFSGKIIVPAGDPGQVTVQRGREMQAFYCSPSCDAPVGPPRSSGSSEMRTASAGGAGTAFAPPVSVEAAPAVPSAPPPLATSALR